MKRKLSHQATRDSSGSIDALSTVCKSSYSSSKPDTSPNVTKSTSRLQINCEALSSASKVRKDLSIIVSTQAEEQFSDEDSVIFELASLLEAKPKRNSEFTKPAKIKRPEGIRVRSRPLSTASSPKAKSKIRLTSPKLTQLTPLQVLMSPAATPRRKSKPDERKIKVLSRHFLLRSPM